MSERTLRCGNCRADITFTSPGTLIVVCEHCSYMNARGDVDIESIGKVAALTPIASQFQVSTEGVFEKTPFVVRGQIQRDHGSGPWNEWAAEDANGEWLWISEAQGQYHVYSRTVSLGALDISRIELGSRIQIPDEPLRFRVSEMGEGRVVTVAGELPYRVKIGETTRYADMQRGEDEVGTIEWPPSDSSGDVEPDVYLGRRVDLDELALDPTTQPEGASVEVSAKRFSCKSCGGRLELQDPENTVRVGCEHCGALLEVGSNKVAIIEAQQKISSKPAIPLGSIGGLRDETYMVLGCMERRVRAEGRWYPWREYLLRTPQGAYHWLIENNGHWQLGWPVQGVTNRSAVAVYRRSSYKHFTSGKAIVHWVLGEFYWEVHTGETVRAIDYVNKSGMLSIERTDSEESTSLSEHIDSAELAAAFKDFKQPRKRGVGPIQPNPHKALTSWFAFTGALVLLMLVRGLATVDHENRTVFQQVLGPLPASTAEEAVIFTDPFEITAKSGNLVIEASVPNIRNGWMGLGGALVNTESGDVTTFATQAQFYSGVSGGSRWSEGNRQGKTTLGSIPKGTYRMRLASSAWGDALQQRYTVAARSQVPRGGYMLLALLAFLIFPILNTIAHLFFESARWSESDHPWGE